MSVQPNPELHLAGEFVRWTDRNVFLTGKAGTGKTTFLHDLKRDCPKRMIVAAPTGVAAINAGGVTLHSFFQLPFGPFVPESEGHDRRGQHHFNRDKIAIIRSLDLLVIDEISMVRADVLDAVDAALRRHRHSDLAFGGVQLLMIGDLYQLAPVVTEAEREILEAHYDSPFFFKSRALARTDLVTVELKHIYRQSDSRFIELLNRVRDNKLDPATLAELNRRHLPGFTPREEEGYITLSTHNRGADAINRVKLESLPARSQRFEAIVEGEFPDYMDPTERVLELKIGAQVMFVRNDISALKRYYNGKIGKVVAFDEGNILVSCPGEIVPIAVEPAVWENTKYRMEPDTKEIVEDKVGKFVQYPLRLAWAITIHKSQGLTFERAIIDARAAFAHGQVYVALSRCKTFEGMVFSSPLSPSSVPTDGKVIRFVDGATCNAPSAETLQSARIDFQRRLLHECFDYQRLRFLLDRLETFLGANAKVVKVLGVDDLEGLSGTCRAEVCAVGERFRRQLSGIFAASPAVPPDSNPAVLERIGKASVYFEEKIGTILGALSGLEIESDNKEIRKRAGLAVAELALEVAVKLAAARSCRTGFSPATYLRVVSAAALDFEAGKPRNAKRKEGCAAEEAGDSRLFKALRQWRARKAAEAGVPENRILRQSAMVEIAATRPGSLWELRKVKGIGKLAKEKYLQELVALVSGDRG